MVFTLYDLWKNSTFYPQYLALSWSRSGKSTRQDDPWTRLWWFGVVGPEIWDRIYPLAESHWWKATGQPDCKICIQGRLWSTYHDFLMESILFSNCCSTYDVVIHLFYQSFVQLFCSRIYNKFRIIQVLVRCCTSISYSHSKPFSRACMRCLRTVLTCSTIQCILRIDSPVPDNRLYTSRVREPTYASDHQGTGEWSVHCLWTWRSSMNSRFSI